jgi:enoyl-CoA hydratase/carnithine racemase
MQMGIVPDAGGTSRLARAVGSALAKDMVLSCRVVGAEEALRAGIVSRVVARERLAAEVDDLAERVASLPWPAAYFANLAIDVGPHIDPRRAADIEGIADQVMLRHEEVQGRVDAFMATKGLKGIPGSKA